MKPPRSHALRGECKSGRSAARETTSRAAVPSCRGATLDAPRSGQTCVPTRSVGTRGARALAVCCICFGFRDSDFGFPYWVVLPLLATGKLFILPRRRMGKSAFPESGRNRATRTRSQGRARGGEGGAARLTRRHMSTVAAELTHTGDYLYRIAKLRYFWGSLVRNDLLTRYRHSFLGIA